MWRLLQQDTPDDYVIATGQSYSLEASLPPPFAEVGLDWQSHVDIDAALFRPSEIAYSAGNPEKLRRSWGGELGWRFQS